MRRDDIYYVHLPNIFKSLNSVERGIRPVVVVSSNIGCATAPIVMIAPLTTKTKKLSCNVDVGWTCNRNREHSQVLCNQLMTVPKAELENCDRVGVLTQEELDKVDDAILVSLGIITKYKHKGDN